MSSELEWERIYNDLDRRADRMGYKAPHQLGGKTSQCYEFRWKGEPALILGFRDVARIANYSSERHLWVEGFEPILRRLVEIKDASQAPFFPPTFGLVYDNMDHAFVLISIRKLLATYSARWQDSLRNVRNLSFGVARTEAGYALQTPKGRPNFKLPHVNTLDPLLSILEVARDPLTREDINRH